MKTSTAIIILGVLVVFTFLVFTTGRPKTTSPSSVSVDSNSNVTMRDGKQIIEIKAKGGYVPRLSEAKAGIPTIIRFNTKGTFDCSSIVRIPSLGINQDLAPSGTTDVDVGVLASGSLQGTCGMGMYRFTVNVKG